MNISLSFKQLSHRKPTTYSFRPLDQIFFKSTSRIAELKQSLKGYTKVELEHFYLCLEGCLAGLGATVISIYMIEKELEWNLLKKISPVVQDNSAYFFTFS